MKCPECRTELPGGSNFCLKCGQELGAEREPSSSIHSPDAERKRVTALFSDLSGYTYMTEKLDPEEVKEITSRIFDGIREIVKKYEGFIERFAGDGVLVLFGVPKAHEDDPIRSIHAAREIHKFVESISPLYEKRLGRDLSMHSGINTGLAVTADVNPIKGTHGVTGDAINVAARLSDLAQASEILVGQDTHRASRDLFTYKALEAVKLKGKTESIRIFQLMSARTTASAGNVWRQISSDMVGRDRPLSKLELQVLKAVNGEGSVVNVVGEAGIGKSRLIAELKKRDVMKRVTLLEGRAISIGKNLSFYPIIELLKQWAAIADDDSEARAFDKLQRAIRVVHPKETNEILPFVATLMGMKLTGRHAERVKGLEGEGLEKLILKNVRELIIQGCELRPTVFVIEDLHWADASSFKLLESLYRLTERYGIVFINVFRPGYLGNEYRGFAELAENLNGHFLEIVIQPLSDGDSKALINNMLEISWLPYSLKTQIIERTGGNPFFVEEVVRSLIDGGALVRKTVGFEVTDKIDSVVIPQTITGVLMARVDRLEESTRELVKVASVIGRSFLDRILRDIADAIEDIDDRLAYLKDIQLIRERTRMREVEYLFNHALAQEAVYESILIQQRKALHLRVARSIEKTFKQRIHEFYGMLAYHYSKGEDLEKAEEYLIKAGEESLRSSASIEALNYYQDGLKLYLRKYRGAADPDKIALFEKNIAIALFNRGRYAKAIGYFDSVLDKLERNESNMKIPRAFKLLYYISSLIKHLYLPLKHSKKMPNEKDIETLDLYYRKAISLVYLDSDRCFLEFLGALVKLNKFDIGKLENGARIWMSASGLFSWTGISFRLSKKILEYTKTAVKNNAKDLFYYDLFELLHNFFTGNWGDINNYDENLLDLNLKKGEFWHASTYLVFHGFINIDQGNLKQTKVMINKLSDIWKIYGNENAREYEDSLKIKLLVKFRKFFDAYDQINSGILFQSKTGREMTILLYIGYKAMVEFYREDYDKAKLSLQEAKEIVSKNANIPPSYVSSYLISRSLLDIYQLEKAIDAKDDNNMILYKKKALESCAKLVKNSNKNACDITKSFRLMGLYYWLTSNYNKSIIYWKNSIKESNRIGARIEAARTYMEIGKRFTEKDTCFTELNGIGAKDYLEKARLIFQDIDLQWDLNELDKISIYHHISDNSLELA